MLDSDGDEVSDAEEVGQGYNPLDATSTPPAGTQVGQSNPAGTDSNGFLGSDFEVLNQIGVVAAQGSGNAAAALFSHSPASPLLYVGAIRTSINYREGPGIALTENLIFETVQSARGLKMAKMVIRDW